jgi:hypothetical protein
MNITVISGGSTHFSPRIYPTSGKVAQDDSVTFNAYGDQAVTFYAQSGLFYWPPGQTEETNNGSTKLTAPPANAPGLTLTIAATPSQVTGYRLSLRGISISKAKQDPPDGTINVGTKSPQ